MFNNRGVNRCQKEQSDIAANFTVTSEWPPMTELALKVKTTDAFLLSLALRFL